MKRSKFSPIDTTALVAKLPAGLFGADVNLEAPAKINLRLKVLGRRADGYHLLSMLNVCASLSDSLCVRLTREPLVAVSVQPSTLQIPSDQNLVARAFRAFWQAIGCDRPPLGMTAHITKRIPTGAGLGGGSSDAGVLLRYLEEVFGASIQSQLGLTLDGLQSLIMEAASTVGADVPYAYHGGACWVTGVGEIVRALPNQDSVWSGEVLIVVPPAAVATAVFYERFRAHYPHLPELADTAMEQAASNGFTELPLSLIDNDFEQIVCGICPEVGVALDVARRFFPESTSLTGSGSAIFSLVPPGDDTVVEACCAAMRSAGMTVHRARILGRNGR